MDPSSPQPFQGLTPDPSTTPCPANHFDRLLSDVIEDKLMAEGADWLIFQPGIYEILCYHFAAQVMQRWQREQATPGPQPEEPDEISC